MFGNSTVASHRPNPGRSGITKPNPGRSGITKPNQDNEAEPGNEDPTWRLRPIKVSTFQFEPQKIWNRRDPQSKPDKLLSAHTYRPVKPGYALAITIFVSGKGKTQQWRGFAGSWLAVTRNRRKKMIGAKPYVVRVCGQGLKIIENKYLKLFDS